MNTLSSRKIPFAAYAGAIGLCLAAAITPVVTAKAQMGPKESEGTISGALLGGIVGGFIGHGGSSSVVGAIAGTAIGGLIGNRIGASLDEQDRAALARATRAAFVSGKSQRFSRRAGVHGQVQVTSSTNIDGKPCRTVRQEIILKDGNVLNDTVSACRGPNGWQV
ncbi:MAG TPA: glycine zipper domain-containing protein [Pseudolabrys sp.]|nr:glycine zipper domain-containing protein [Pseudolabrys sp.]